MRAAAAAGSDGVCVVVGDVSVRDTQLPGGLQDVGSVCSCLPRLSARQCMGRGEVFQYTPGHLAQLLASMSMDALQGILWTREMHVIYR
jgi:hypothetical protein